MQNLNIAAASYAAGGYIEELPNIVGEKCVIAKETRYGMVDLEHELRQKAEILKYEGLGKEGKMKAELNKSI